MSERFEYDVFLSHSAKDKPIVRELAERLSADGLRVWLDEWEIQPGDMVLKRIEDGLRMSRVLLLAMSEHFFVSEWATLESGTFRFRDPTNAQRRFIPLRLDDVEIPEVLRQFAYVDWRQASDEEFSRLLMACRPGRAARIIETADDSAEVADDIEQHDSPARCRPPAAPDRDRVFAPRAKSRPSDQVRRLPGDILREPGSEPFSLASHSADLKAFREWPWWACCCPIKDASPRSLRIQPSIGRRDSFCPTADYTRVVELLKNKRDVLICGRPKSGKTRLAFEVMRHFEDAWLLYLRPAMIAGEHIGQQGVSIPRLPAQIPLAFLFYDDLEKYDEIQNPDGLLLCLDPNRTVAVITVRNDPEYGKAERIFRRAMQNLNAIEIEPLDEKTGERAAAQAGITEDWQDGFDGTIGWIMLGPRAKKEVLDSWEERALPRAILQSCKLLRKCGIYTYREEEVRDLSIEMFGAKGDEVSWREAIHLLDETAFLLKGHEGVDASGELDVYDAHLDQIVDLDFDITLLRRLIVFWAASGSRENLENLATGWRWQESQRRIIIRALQQCIARDANRALYHHLIAQMVDTEDLETAERRKAAAIEPDNPEWSFALGSCLKRDKKPEAEVWLRRAYDLKPTSAYAEALGDFLAGVPERQQEAVAFYQAALKHDNENQKARWSLAKSLVNIPNEADRACDLAIAAVKNARYLCCKTSEIPPQPCASYLGGESSGSNSRSKNRSKNGTYATMKIFASWLGWAG